MIRAVIADDQELVRAGFRMILDAQPDIEVVAEAADGAQAVAAVTSSSPDVVLMDIRMPGMDGLSATRAITAQPGAPRVLVLTTFDTEEYVYQALKSGASGFLLKTAPPGRLVDAVRMINDGEALLAPSITRRLIETYMQRPPPGHTMPAALGTLTERERDVLHAIGRGLSNREIATEFVVSEATVKTHVNRVFTKLGLRDRVHAVVLAYETGLIQPGQRPAPTDEAR
jgi:DNA-binding NarL/FixJ family response regulator